MLLIKCDL